MAKEPTTLTLHAITLTPHTRVQPSEETAPILLRILSSPPPTPQPEMLIASLVTHAPSSNITAVTDSQAACPRFASGRISTIAATVLSQWPELPLDIHRMHPARRFLPGNEVAQATAHHVIHRAFPEEEDRPLL
ncbi:hypothetical protein HPB48_004214 [Haemaphysalis longicornis]|uniref:Uncharacterized protein n=1 Tax=Haemaphysalis longicornis TaxID=44386 RepID=A0A9J6GE61_HAELO|nr:hypothetical protein HPB48_004214 [Haemaphysalis longicornis]